MHEGAEENNVLAEQFVKQVWRKMSGCGVGRGVSESRGAG